MNYNIYFYTKFTITRFKVNNMGIGKYITFVVAASAIAVSAVYASCKLPGLRHQVEKKGDYIAYPVKDLSDKVVEIKDTIYEHTLGNLVDAIKND